MSKFVCQFVCQNCLKKLIFFCSCFTHKAYCSEFDNLGNIPCYNVNKIGNIIICGQSKHVFIFISIWP